jgi:hypothetical protein
VVDKYFVRLLGGNKRIRRKKATFILYALYYVVLVGYLETISNDNTHVVDSKHVTSEKMMEGENDVSHEEEAPAA